MKLTIDFETRSECALIKRGIYNYAADPTTEILCMAVKVDADPTKIWVPEKFRDKTSTEIDDTTLSNMIEQTKHISSHNAQFERLIWDAVMYNRLGFPKIPMHEWRCTAAKAAAYSLPRSLGGACAALGLPIQKDMAGHRLMLAMCRPRTPTLKDPAKWRETPDDFLNLCEYCRKDVEAEYALDKHLHDVSETEIKLFHLDQKINDRGLKVDLPSIDKLIVKVEVKEKELTARIRLLTKGAVNSAKQVNVLLTWLHDEGLSMETLDKEAVADALREEGLSPTLREILEIRQSLGKSSVAKLAAMKKYVCEDGRVRGTLLFHGASTGRWGGKAIQPHNFPRDSFKTKEEVDFVVQDDVELIEMVHDCMIQAASKCLRGMLIGEKSLGCTDYNAVEARVIAWLADETHVLTSFKEGKDLYKAAAHNIYGCGYDNVTKAQRMIGKAATLALGYQGWLGAFTVMAKGYGLHLEEEEATEIIRNWRAAHPKIVQFWYGLEAAAMKTVRTGKSHACGPIRFGIRNKFLHMRLPSGRLLAYYDPQIKKIDTKYEKGKYVVTFMGVHPKTFQWTRMATYGGKLAENASQAAARDLLAYSLTNADAKGYDIVSHIHDEMISEVDPKNFNLSNYNALMTEKPEWAAGLPLAAEGFVCERYRKG